jgi:phage shock protein A
LSNELQDLQVQHDQLRAQEEKLVAASRRLDAKVQAFRTRKETIKASYSAAEAETKVGEALTGISEEMSDVGLAMQRAEDKVAQMEARSGALDELMAGGALDDLSATSDPLGAELRASAEESLVDSELSRLKGELGRGDDAKELESPAREESQ